MALNLLKNDFISAEQARGITQLKKMTIDSTMSDIKMVSENKRFEVTYDLRDKQFEDGVVETLISLGYDVKLKRYDDGSAYLTINWYNNASLKEQVDANIPSYFKK